MTEDTPVISLAEKLQMFAMRGKCLAIQGNFIGAITMAANAVRIIARRIGVVDADQVERDGAERNHCRKRSLVLAHSQKPGTLPSGKISGPTSTAYGPVIIGAWNRAPICRIQRGIDFNHDSIACSHPFQLGRTIRVDLQLRDLEDIGGLAAHATLSRANSTDDR